MGGLGVTIPRDYRLVRGRWVAVLAAVALVVSAFVAPAAAAPSQAVDNDDSATPSAAPEGDPELEAEPESETVDPSETGGEDDVETEVDPAPETEQLAAAGVVRPVTDEQLGLKIAGTVRVGKTLKASVKQAAIPSGYTVSYQWYRDDAALTDFRIKGAAATQPEYKVKTQELGRKLWVVATLTRSSDSFRYPSAETVAVAPGTFSALKPAISGQAKVSKQLKVTYAKPQLGKLSILWLRNGVSTGVTGATYNLGNADRGKRISARLTLTHTGYTTKVATSKKTAKVAGLALLTFKKPRIKGEVQNGSTLKIVRGAWTKNTKFKYQWYVAGKKVPGATKKSFKVTKQHQGKLITARVTGSKKDYYTKASTSAPAVIVGLRGPRDKNGWAWPTDIRRYGYGYHDGYSVDIAASAGGPVYAPYSGVVVKMGGDGGGIPWVCQVNTNWWRGENQTVIIRHKYKGKTVYSSVNHVAKGSTKALGITAGSKVKAGQQIATEGMSGCTSGPHNHFLMKNSPGNYWGDVKPEKYIGQPNR